MPDQEPAVVESGEKRPRVSGISCASPGAKIPSCRIVYQLPGAGGDGSPLRFSESIWARGLAKGVADSELFFSSINFAQ